MEGEAGRGEGKGGGGPLLLFGEDEIIIMKWSSIPLLLFEGREIMKKAPHSIIII